MQFTTFAILATALVPFALATGNAKVTNNCNDTIYLWSVGSQQSDVNIIKKGETYSEKLRFDPKTGGIALKITKSQDGLFNGSPQTTFSYSLDGNNIWYDLSNTFGDTFAGSKLVVAPSITTCPSITWATGVNPGGSQVKVCDASSDITLTTCAA